MLRLLLASEDGYLYVYSLGMNPHKISIITIFGHNHFKQKNI